MFLLTTDEMRRIDRATIDSGHASALELMERAGLGVVEAIERHYGSPLGMRALVLCGAGNNGGDGFVAARHLARRGADVRVGLLGDRDRLKDEARAHLDRLETAGVPVAALADDSQLGRFLAERDSWDFAIDALLGTGSRGAPEGLLATGVAALGELRAAGARIVAVDMPTGADADSGAVAGQAVASDLTVTFGFPKRGQFLYPARAILGALEVIDIGLSPGAVESAAPPATLATAPEMASLLPVRDPRAHKGSLGRVLVMGGSEGLTGAVTLAARGALRSGAGYVQTAVPRSLHDVLETKLTEATTIPLPETPSRSLAAAALEPFLQQAGRADVLALGPGLSRHTESAGLARRIVAVWDRTLVLDADGLNAFEGRAHEIGHGRAARILTPHLFEMRRLTGLELGAIEARKIEVALEWAERWRSVVVLKGPPTVTASPDGVATVNPNGNPGLATLGTGDVLTGVIAGLAAQGLGAYDAARLGVYLHGMAGDLTAGERGQAGMVAGDVVESLPLAMLGLERLRG